jgi:hypothetical protein
MSSSYALNWLSLGILQHLVLLKDRGDMRVDNWTFVDTAFLTQIDSYNIVKFGIPYAGQPL